MLDTARRELMRGSEFVAVEPQVFDLLEFLIAHRNRVVSKDDLVASVWGGRIVSDSAITSRITAVRHAIGDSGETQRLIRTIPRKGFRFAGEVRRIIGLPIERRRRLRTSSSEQSRRRPFQSKWLRLQTALGQSRDRASCYGALYRQCRFRR